MGLSIKEREGDGILEVRGLISRKKLKKTDCGEYAVRKVKKEVVFEGVVGREGLNGQI